MTIPFAVRLSVPPHVLIRQIENESVLLNLQNERYFGLDEVGTRMWTSLIGAGSIQAAYEELLAEYEVDHETLRRDLRKLISQLVGSGLLVVVHG